jgi:hypothetical protein
MFKHFVLTVLNEGPDSFLLGFVHDNFGAAYFLRCLLDSFVKVVRADVVLDKGLEILQDTDLLELRLELF